MRCSEVSRPTAVARMVSGPVRLTSPALTARPGPAKTGRVSPVSSERSSSDLPAVISPSTGIRPPGRTSTRSPTAMAATGDLLFTGPVEPDRARHFQRRQFLGGRTRDGAGPVIEIAPGKQEEGQRQRRVEIGMFARERWFPRAR